MEFAFDVQVPQPNAGDGTDSLSPEWRQLFMLSGFLAARLQEKAAGCARFTMPPSFDSAGIEKLTFGGTFTNLPSNPKISADLSEYGDYLITGSIQKLQK